MTFVNTMDFNGLNKGLKLYCCEPGFIKLNINFGVCFCEVSILIGCLLLPSFYFALLSFFTLLPMDFELLNVFSGLQIGAKLNGRGDATTKLEMICLQVRKLNFLNEMQLGDFPVLHTTDDIAFFWF